MDNGFQPAWWLPGSHLQSIWGRLVRDRRAVSLRREIVETPDGDELILDHLEAPSSPVRFILLHGLEGSSNSVYIQGMLRLISRAGYQATAVNFRYCARTRGDLSQMIPNRRLRMYHSGETTDLDFVVRLLSNRHPEEQFIAFGGSLGGNILLKWLGENPDQALLRAAATISVPYDLGEGARYMEDAIGKMYTQRFLRTLKPKVVEKTKQFPHETRSINLERVLRSETFREFDDAATAPIHGFRDADDYYERSSSLRFLSRIQTPTLCVSSVDDPFLPPAALAAARSVASPAVEFRVTGGGGHLGFIGGPLPWKPLYWCEKTVFGWLEDRVPRTSEQPDLRPEC